MLYPFHQFDESQFYANDFLALRDEENVKKML
jgi:hypothetical protein